jgi:hypothetical protein
VIHPQPLVRESARPSSTRFFATAKIGSVSAVTWIGSVQAFLFLIAAPVVETMCDTGKAQHVVRIGTALLSV